MINTGIWINQKEQLPEINELVLAWLVDDGSRGASNGCVLAVYDKWENWIWQQFDCYCTGSTKTFISHWQKLPECPIAEFALGELINR